MIHALNKHSFAYTMEDVQGYQDWRWLRNIFKMADNTPLKTPKLYDFR